MNINPEAIYTFITGTGLVGALRVYHVVKTNLKKREIALEEREARIISSLSKVMAKTVQTQVDSALESLRHTRQAQIDDTTDRLNAYADQVSRTASDAVDQMGVCENDKGLVVELYADSVKQTFPSEVRTYFVNHVISKNGFKEMTDSDFIVRCEEVRKQAFKIFIDSYFRRFRDERLLKRADYLRQNVDPTFMLALVTDILLSCRSHSIAYHNSRDLSNRDLATRIERDIKAEL